jgi:hypothetical protein
MLDGGNRADHYNDLAGECCRLALTSFSTQMRTAFGGWRRITASWLRPRKPGTLVYGD